MIHVRILSVVKDNDNLNESEKGGGQDIDKIFWGLALDKGMLESGNIIS